MRKNLLRAMPPAVQETLLQATGIACSDVLSLALVDAGPGTQQDRRDTLKSVYQRVPRPPSETFMTDSSDGDSTCSVCTQWGHCAGSVRTTGCVIAHRGQTV